MQISESEVLAGAPAIRHNFLELPIPGSSCSQGGVKVPTGGKGEAAQARERLLRSENSNWNFLLRKGQQIRCDSEADG
jgi:hypothetical protein